MCECSGAHIDSKPRASSAGRAPPPGSNNRCGTSTRQNASPRSCSSGSSGGLVDRDENRMPDLPLDMLRQVALAGRVLDEDYLAGADDPALAVAGGDFDPRVAIAQVLT